MPFFQSGRRYFSRREITALVGGPVNIAVYRHILVIPPTAKVLPPKNEKPPTAKTLPPCCITAEKIPLNLVSPLPLKKYQLYRYGQKSTANSRYRPKGTANTAYRPKGTADTGYRPKGTAYTDTAPKVSAFLFVFVLCPLLFLLLRVPRFLA